MSWKTAAHNMASRAVAQVFGDDVQQQLANFAVGDVEPSEQIRVLKYVKDLLSSAEDVG
eukprot:gene25783-11465_t